MSPNDRWNKTNETSGAVGGSEMASVTLDVTGLEPLYLKGEAHNLSQRWKKCENGINQVN